MSNSQIQSCEIINLRRARDLTALKLTSPCSRDNNNNSNNSNRQNVECWTQVKVNNYSKVIIVHCTRSFKSIRNLKSTTSLKYFIGFCAIITRKLTFNLMRNDAYVRDRFSFSSFVIAHENRSTIFGDSCIRRTSLTLIA